MLGKQRKLPAPASMISVPPRMPRARSDQSLIVEDLASELLVYDKNHDLAHCLSATARRVWRACDGTRTADEIATFLDLDPATVKQALSELDGWELLDYGASLGPRHTRREMSIKVAKVGAAAALTPVLMTSIVAPAAAQSASEIQRCFDLVGPTDNCGNQCHQGCCCCCRDCTSPGEPGDTCRGRSQGICVPRGMNPSDYCQAVLGGDCTGGGFGGGCP